MNHYIGEIPTGTIFINVFGCFLLAFILAVALEILEFNSDLKLGITTGLLGAFTSFAMFCKETVILITRGLYISAVFYIVISIALAFSAVYAGMVLARKFLVKIKGKKNNVQTESIPGEGGEE